MADESLRMSEASDWEPLPQASRWSHPGELGAVPEPIVAPVQPGRLAPAKPAPVEPSPPDPVAEAALRILQQRLAASKPATSLIAAVQHREQRQRRRRAAAQAPFADAVKVVHSTLRGPEDVPVPSAALAPVALDAREHEGWFQALPTGERTRLRQTWAMRQQQAGGAQAVMQRNRNRRTVAAVVIASAVVVLGTGIAWHATVGAGVLCGIWWRHVLPDRFRDPVIAFVCLLVTHLVALLANGHISTGLFMDAILMVAFAAVVGFDGEIQHTGGFDAV
jgi:hypothetical protein